MARILIGIARKNTEAEKSDAEFRIARIEALTVKDNSFDCVLSSLMIHYLPLR